VLAVVAALALLVALPTTSLGYNTASPSYVQFASGVVPGAKFVPLVNSGETIFGDTFEGIPDGIGVVPIDDNHVDLYVTHEQSRVPFGGFADFVDSSVTRIRVNTDDRSVEDMEVVLPSSAGFIRFCSAFMAGPQHGFDTYTFLVNEESDDNLAVPAGAVYGSDPAMAPLREAGYTVYLDTVSGEFDEIAGMGRHNHENAVVVPGGWDDLAVLSGDDTFNAPASQLYLYTAEDADAFKADEGTLWAFRVTATDAGPLTGPQIVDPLNGANDYADITTGETWSGEFLTVPEDVAKGDLAATHPQAGLENWSNANNVFQFIRVEDIAYDPDNPRVIYFADTGERRALTDAVWTTLDDRDGTVNRSATGRLHRGLSAVLNPDMTVKYPADPPGPYGNGRIFRMVLNADDPTVVDEFSVFLESDSIGMRNPDNIEVGRKSIVVQEDTSNAKVWQYRFVKGNWRQVATAVQPTAETSGIVDVSAWFGGGWWALDVQSHVNLTESPTQPGGFKFRREDGQLLLMFIPGS